MISNKYKKNKIYTIGISLLLFLFVLIFYLFQIFPISTQKSYELFLNLRGPRKAHPKIVIVSVDDETMKYFNQKWPLKRSYFAQAITNIALQAPRVIGIDFIFSNNSNKQEDQALANSFEMLTKKSSVVLAFALLNQNTYETVNNDLMLVHKKSIEKSLPLFKGKHALINVPVNHQDQVYQTFFIKNENKNTYFSFAFEVFKQYHSIKDKTIEFYPKDRIFIPGYFEIPLENNNNTYINYTGPSGTFNKISFFQVYENEIPKDFFKNKIVLIGPTFTMGKDFSFTPFSHFNGIYSKTSGIEIHANIVDALLQKKFLSRFSSSLEFIIIFIILMMIIILFILQFSPLKILISTIGSLILYYLLAFFLFFQLNKIMELKTIAFSTSFTFLILWVTTQSIKMLELKKLEKQFQAQNTIPQNFFKKYDISKREKEIILMILEGLTNAEIGRKLYISLSTVKKHVYNIYKKADVKNKVELINMVKVPPKNS